MNNVRKKARDPAATRRQLLEATTRLMLRQGYAATTVDQICEEAELTKGSFFHHFANKEAIGLEAMNAFAQTGMELYMAASSELGLKPIERVHRQLEAMMLLARTHGEHL